MKNGALIAISLCMLFGTCIPKARVAETKPPTYSPKTDRILELEPALGPLETTEMPAIPEEKQPTCNDSLPAQLDPQSTAAITLHSFSAKLDEVGPFTKYMTAAEAIAAASEQEKGACSCRPADSYWPVIITCKIKIQGIELPFHLDVYFSSRANTDRVDRFSLASDSQKSQSIDSWKANAKAFLRFALPGIYPSQGSFRFQLKNKSDYLTPIKEYNILEGIERKQAIQRDFEKQIDKIVEIPRISEHFHKEDPTRNEGNLAFELLFRSAAVDVSLTFNEYFSLTFNFDLVSNRQKY